MSTNIDHSEYLKGKLYIQRKHAQMVLRKYGDDLAEDNFLVDLDIDEGDLGENLEIARFAWTGEFSGHAYDDTLPHILKLTTGTADLLFSWEGGDFCTGLRVEDGKITKKKVKKELE